MKPFSLIFMLFICNLNPLQSQLTNDFPFKTYLDSSNNLYITGYSNSNGTQDIYVAKFPPIPSAPALWFDVLSNSFGNDRGFDLAIDKRGNTVITGSFLNHINNTNETTILCYNNSGVMLWSHTQVYPNDDKGLGVSLTLNEQGIINDIFITGYRSSQFEKDILISQYNFDGNLLFDTTYNSPYNFDDVGTDIKLDAGHAYVCGYSYRGPEFKNDIMLIK